MSKLYELTNYKSDYSHIISSIIREYDISKANISVLFSKGAITEEQYYQLYNSDRMTRQVTIGKMMAADSNLYPILKEGICEARRMFFEANKVQDEEVLAIKNDAIYLIGREAVNTEFGLIRFVPKSMSTSFYRIKNKEYYYYYNAVSDEENLDIKGMSMETLTMYHDNFFMDFLRTVFYSAQMDSIANTLEILNYFYTSYINRKLPVEYYRTFDGESSYFLPGTSFTAPYKANYLPECQKPYVDIAYNLSILQELQRIYSCVFFQRNKLYAQNNKM